MVKNPKRQSGFTTVELAMVVGMTLILSTLATFGLQSFLRAYRAGADARAVASQLSLARMRASSAFTRAQLFVNADARTYQVRRWTPGAHDPIQPAPWHAPFTCVPTVTELAPSCPCQASPCTMRPGMNFDM